jgi:hypothetical protein
MDDKDRDAEIAALRQQLSMLEAKNDPHRIEIELTRQEEDP